MFAVVVLHGCAGILGVEDHYYDVSGGAPGSGGRGATGGGASTGGEASTGGTSGSGGAVTATGGVSSGGSGGSELDAGNPDAGGAPQTDGGGSGGAPAVTCAAPLTNCDDEPTDCETDLTALVSCGTSCATVEPCTNTNATSSTCTAGACVFTCKPGFADCDGKGSNGCEADFTDPATCGSCTKHCLWPTSVCSAGACLLPPSCKGLANKCGPAQTESCCDSVAVGGATYARKNEEKDARTVETTVSPFYLDKYEITVGRFRKFVDAWVGGWRPKAGDGKHRHLNGGKGLATTAGGYESGWDPQWETKDAYPVFGDTVKAWADNLTRCTYDDVPATSGYSAWASGDDFLPINCANWWEMAAFCIWDDAFLPSEAEWELVATGGPTQYDYPWGNDPPIEPAAGINPTRAAYDCHYSSKGDTPGTAINCLGNTDCFAHPGIIANGKGFYGHYDLAGNMAEWTQDAYHPPYPGKCVDCVDALDDTGFRVTRGGGFASKAFEITTSRRGAIEAFRRYDGHGARCARRK